MTRLRDRAGFSLAELLIVGAIIGLTVSVVLPGFSTFRDKNAVRAASREIATEVRKARSLAIARSRHTAIKFNKVGDTWMYSLYEDGDFDGVRNDDIRAGRDLLMQPARALLVGSGGARIGFPKFATLTDPDDDTTIDQASSPVRFGPSQLCSFSATGTGSAGSIYLTDGKNHAAVVRIVAATGRVRVLRFDSLTSKWVSR